MKRRLPRTHLRFALVILPVLALAGLLTYPAETSSLRSFGVAGVTTAAVAAAEGDLDPSFDGDGKLVPGQFSGFDSIYDVVVQPDGKLVAAGESDFTFVLARYETDGRLDPTFGTGGVVRAATPGWSPSGYGRKGERIVLALQADGKIVLGGTVNGAAGAGADFGLRRFNADGTPDTFFGTNGLVTTDIDSGVTTSSQSARRQNYLRDIAIQPDGKILAVGGSDIPGGIFSQAGSHATVRYNGDGSLDSSFGSGGVVKLGGDALALQPDGKIVIASGAAYQFDTTNAFRDSYPMFLRRLNSNGTIDTTFNGSPTQGNASFAPGVVGQAFSFDGSGDAVPIGNPPPLHYTVTFSIEAWVKRGSAASTSSSGDGVIFGWGPDGYVFGIKPDGRLFLRKNGDGTETVSSSRVVGDTNFHHVAVTSTSGNSGVNFYVDGVADTPRRYHPVYEFDNSSKAAIGAEGGAFEGSFLGLVDELNIYSTVLTQAQIQSIVAAGSAGKCKPGAPVPGCVAPPEGMSAWYPGDGDTGEITGVVGGLAFAYFFNQLEATARDVLIQPDGRIVVAGYVFSNATGNPKVCALARFNADGTPDTSFDTDGKVTTDAGGSSEINRMALQPDGSIVAAGVKDLYTSRDDFLVMRYLPHGALDPNFGTGGIVSTDFGAGRRDSANALALQADGRLVAAGVTTVPGTGRDFAIARYNLNGSLDDGTADDATPGDSYGVGGRVVTALTSGASASDVRDIAVQPDGKILAGVSYGSGFLILRYNPDGSLDTSFGRGGAATASFDSRSSSATTNLADHGVHLRLIELLPNGKIVAAGGQYLGGFTNDLYGMIARFNADGSPDNSFSGDGLVQYLVTIGSDSYGNTSEGAHAMTVLPDGSVVVGGAFRSGSDPAEESFIHRFDVNGNSAGSVFTDYSHISALAALPDGSMLALDTGGFNGDRVKKYLPDLTPDPGFGLDGVVTTDFFSTDIGVLSDGRFVVGGSVQGSGFSDFVLARYNPDGSPDTTFDGDGKTVLSFGAFDGINDFVLLPNCKLLVGGFSITSNVSEAFIARLNGDGTLDTSFGGGGRRTTDVPVFRLAVQADGKIVTSGAGLARYLHTVEPGSCPTAVPTPTPCTGGARLDTTFDTDGRVTTHFGNRDQARAVVVQPDGKIVAAGTFGSSSPTFNLDFGLARYNADGSPDTSFDTDGKVNTHFGTSDAAYAVALQPDGRVVVAGSAFVSSANGSDFALVRYNADGSPDTSFDTDGKVTTPFVSNSSDQAVGVVIQPDGKIVAAGSTRVNSQDDFALARYNADGSLDTTFDSDGRVTTSFGTGDDLIAAIALQSDGKIVVAGRARVGSKDEFALARYNADGSPDTSFDTDGKLTTNIGPGHDTVSGLAIQPDGRIVVAGGAGDDTFNIQVFAFARYNADGSLDTTFDADGKLTVDFSTSDNRAHAVAVQPDGKIVAAGFADDGSNEDFALLRLNPDGSRDASFAPGGRVTTDFNNLTFDEEMANAVAVQPDGRIVAAGHVDVIDSGIDFDFALARYGGVCTTPTPTPTPTPMPTPTPSPGVTAQFSQSTFSVTEGCVPATLTVTLSGPPTGTVSVDYTVSEGTAKQKTDFTFVAGTLLPQPSAPAQGGGAAASSGGAPVSGSLTFAPGETAKEITVLINEDGFAEGTEDLSATLSNPRGASLGSVETATLNINDNETVDSQANPIDEPATYVCQLYHDFLHRQPDPAGLQFWTEGITGCGTNQACVQTKRHDVAAAFFLSIEFQQTGYYVFRAYGAGLNRRPQYEEFMRDLNAVALGVEVGVGDWEQRLSDQKRAFAEQVVERAEFKALMPDGMTAEAFAGKLFEQAGVPPTAAEREAVVAAYGVGNTQGRAAALMAALEAGSVYNRLYNSGFVLVEYFGFLRRDPDDPPDSDMSGFDFWLQKMDSFTQPGEDARLETTAFERIKRSEMIRAFIIADEYRKRFGP